MRARHVAHAVPAFPVYSAAFLSPSELLLGGGGGSSKSGIKNKLRLYRVDEFLSMKLADELELDAGEDAPMSMAVDPSTRILVCGINSTPEKMESGQNQNCRLYAVGGTQIKPLTALGTLKSDDPEDYQRVTTVSPDGRYVAVAGTHDLTVLGLPSLAPIGTRLEKDEIYDVAFSPTSVIVATTANLQIYALPPGDDDESEKQTRASKGKGKGTDKGAPAAPLKHLRTVERPKLPGGEPQSAFRAARFNPQDARAFYTVVNTAPARGKGARGAKAAPRRAYVVKWDAGAWAVDKVKKVGDKGVTSFDVSANGRWLAYGSSDFTIGLLDAQTLTPLLSILKAHEFPSTTLRFSPSSRLLVSGSADNTVRMIAVPETLGDSAWGMYFVLLMAVFVVLFALAVQLFVVGAL
ncbi:hypothetical protein HETIRDRAFT_473217 [Heterobasidion irregulare TC 32-1]|uniref:Uncharacterized protein n=1 Tax=Heterobasidion irregulare (strain TC 32-1) TaxID=747525 RepID=W4KFN8_HETIT|nr:uncharacterized protein HETIRDRAFT_473217 [Heterobasidion irregulare TC 32-1]ETW84544.1 hypothetical protein HETIRDRAFT_473217 [Heterobasidion irregulare TC 32-1]